MMPVLAGAVSEAASDSVAREKKGLFSNTATGVDAFLSSTSFRL
jgi:hypothetical protein